VVGVGQHLFEILSRLFEAPRAAQGLHQPEAADRKCPLVALEAVVCGLANALAVDVRFVHQFVLYPVDGRSHARIGPCGETGE
jgi:hypothetical protein